jgi:hypothetical protein
MKELRENQSWASPKWEDGEDNMTSTLWRRFDSFVRTLDGFEDIDALLKNRTDLHGKKRADYLFQGRQIIVEQKRLVSNPIYRPQGFAAKTRRDRRIVVYGTVSTRSIFSAQPDADALQRKIILDLAKRISADVADADKQTRDTRLIFDIPDAVGIIVLLNEGAEILTPDVIGYAVSNAFQERSNEGARRYTHSDGVIGISEAQTLPVQALPTYPINTFTSPQTNRAEIVVAFSDMLISKWATFNHATLNIQEE